MSTVKFIKLNYWFVLIHELVYFLLVFPIKIIYYGWYRNFDRKAGEFIMNWKPGDIGYHKATMERLVVSSLGLNEHNRGKIFVTLASGKKEVYKAEELWTEAEWKTHNANEISAVSHEPDFTIG